MENKAINEIKGMETRSAIVRVLEKMLLTQFTGPPPSFCG